MFFGDKRVLQKALLMGDNDTPAPPTDELGGSWTLWKNLARQSPQFGNPDKFCQNIPKKVGLFLQHRQQTIKICIDQ